MLAKRSIGLLGGSFNPAHDGHLHISREALKRLKLDEIWWLVSPKNPLKSSAELADYAKRLSSARRMAQHARIRVLDVEHRHGLYFTADTLRYLTKRHRGTHFVWLMGADNLTGFHRWRAWKTIARMVPIAVLDRAPYALRALHGPFARCFNHRRAKAAQSQQLATMQPPAWLYLTIPLHFQSASHLRKTLGSRAFMVHTEDQS